MTVGVDQSVGIAGEDAGCGWLVSSCVAFASGMEGAPMLLSQINPL